MAMCTLRAVNIVIWGQRSVYNIILATEPGDMMQCGRCTHKLYTRLRTVKQPFPTVLSREVVAPALACLAGAVHVVKRG